MTQPGCEAQAALHLRRQKRFVFTPIVLYRRASDQAIVSRQRFPGYVLLQLDLDKNNWRSVNTAIGVRHLLPVYSETPMPLPTGFVERLMETPDKDTDALLVEHYAESEVVRIIAGPLEGLLAAIERQDGERIRARLDNGAVVETRTAGVERA